MILSSIVAVAQNNVIGKDNDLIWDLPEEMKFFVSKTAGHCVITGRKNYESIPEKFRPLPNRINIVITRQDNYDGRGALIVPSIKDAIRAAEKTNDEEVFIIGGGEIYKQSLDLIDKLYITRIYKEYKGDAYFPELDLSQWIEISHSDVITDKKSGVQFAFYEYNKKEQ